jgi:cyclopropane-fatty-acyl-phospholipid synthase
VNGVTLSAEQLALAKGRVCESGFEDKVTLELRDYRDVTGSFDRIVSIEMVEAVGEAFWPDYFQALHDRLRPGGTVVLQAITIDESRYESYRQSPDFIQRHVFPGGMLPTRSASPTGGGESWACVFVLRAFRAELRADALGVASAFPRFAASD